MPDSTHFRRPKKDLVSIFQGWPPGLEVTPESFATSQGKSCESEKISAIMKFSKQLTFSYFVFRDLVEWLNDLELEEVKWFEIPVVV